MYLSKEGFERDCRIQLHSRIKTEISKENGVGARVIRSRFNCSENRGDNRAARVWLVVKMTESVMVSSKVFCKVSFKKFLAVLLGMFPMEDLMM